MKKRQAAPVSDLTPEELAEANGTPAPGGESDLTPAELAEANAPDKFQAPADDQRFEAPGNMSRAPQTPLNLPPEKPGFLAGIGQALRGAGHALVSTPGEFLHNPGAASRGFETGMARGATFGAARSPEQQLEELRRLGERVETGSASPEDMERLRSMHDFRFGKTDPGHPFDPNELIVNKIDRLKATVGDLAKAPNSQLSGELLAPSPIRAGAGKLIAGGGRGAGFAERAARGVGAGAAVSGGEGALREIVAGGSASDVAEAGLHGAGAGAVMAVPGVALGEVARGARKGLGAIFPNVKRFAEARDTKIQGQSSKYAAPGRFAGPGPDDLIREADRLPKGNAGVDEAAIGARDRIKSKMEQTAAEEGQRYHEGVEALPGMDELQREPVEQVHRDLERAVIRLDNGRVATGSGGAAKLVEGVKKNLTATTGQELVPVRERTRTGPERTVGMAPGEEIQSPAATGRDMLKERRGVRAAAQFGASGPVDAKTRAAREIYGALNEALKGNDQKPGAIPGLRQLDERYSQFKRGQARTNDILLRSEEGGRSVQVPETPAADTFDAAEPAPKWRVNDDARAARTIARINDDTIPARDMAPYFKELLADPHFKAALDKVIAKKALEETKFFSGPGQGEQIGLHDVSGAGAAVKFGVKKLGAIARKVDDRVLRHANGSASVPFFGRLGSKRQDEEERR